MHGGKSTGPKTLKAGGRHSKFLPRRLAARYEEVRHDAELIALADELALLDARLGELLAGLDTTAAAAWQRARVVCERAKRAGNEDRQALLRELDRLLDQGGAEAQQWAEIARLIEQRRRLAEIETRRLVQMQQFLTVQQANLLVAAVVRVVQEHVPDPDTRTRLAIELARLLDRPAPEGS